MRAILVGRVGVEPNFCGRLLSWPHGPLSSAQLPEFVDRYAAVAIAIDEREIPIDERKSALDFVRRQIAVSVAVGAVKFSFHRQRNLGLQQGLWRERICARAWLWCSWNRLWRPRRLRLLTF